jgi:hypothetical protein
VELPLPLPSAARPFQLYTKLGFELERYEAVYAKPVPSSASIA